MTTTTSSPTRYSAFAEDTTCPACGASVKAADVYGTTVRVDRRPITSAGEITAMLEGRATYALDNRRLERRVDRLVSAVPAGTLYAAHVCNLRPIEPLYDPFGLAS